VEVERLFGQVPARRKFLRSEPAEAARVSEVLEWLALGHPGVALALWQDGRCSLDLPAVEEPARRVLDVLGDALGSDPLEVDVASALAADRPLHVWGRVGRPERARAHAKGLRLTLNGRPIADRGLMHAVREAYRGLIEPGRTPVGFVGIQIDPREVDVNVHPAKSEVRFRQPSAVHALVHRAVKTALRSADLMPELGGSAGATWMPTGPGGWNLPAPRGAAATFDIGQVRHAMSEPAAPAPIFAQPDTPLPAPVAAPRFLQAGRAWLVTSDAEGLVVVDQHALHERVMFERLREQVLTGSLASQPLLAPRVEAASSMELERLEEAQPLLRRLGYDVRAAGPRSLAVHAEPVFLLERGVDALELLRDWLGREDFRADGDGETLWADVLDMMACKAAVKAGDALGDAEIARLLQQLAQVERSTNCPHGRPTAMRIPWRDLERKFGRSPSVRRPV
jgi:DNA mismatch repair protein MutL